MIRTNPDPRSIPRSLYSKFYYGLRLSLHRKPRILRTVQTLRAQLMLEPLNGAIVRCVRMVRTNRPITPQFASAFPALNMSDTVGRINKNGYAHLGTLPEPAIRQILDYCDAHKRVRYWNPHKECGAVERISRDEQIIQVAREYIGLEPIVWLSRLWWTIPPVEGSAGLLPSIHPEPDEYGAHCFHYDTLDFKSLTLFVYVTDVDIDSFPHVVIEGTHRRKTFTARCNRLLDDMTAKRLYGNRLRIVVGERGTAFFEDTSTFHKVSMGHRKRLMLSIDYVLQRRVPPDRPTRAVHLTKSE